MRKKTWILCAAMCVALTGCSASGDKEKTDIIQISSETVTTTTTTEEVTTASATAEQVTTTEAVSQDSTGKTQAAGKTEPATTQAQGNSSTDEKTEAATTQVQDEEPADDSWKEAFEKTLYEEYGVVPDHYEYIGNDVYQVYVEIDGNVVPYVAVNCKTGDFHG